MFAQVRLTSWATKPGDHNPAWRCIISGLNRNRKSAADKVGGMIRDRLREWVGREEIRFDDKNNWATIERFAFDSPRFSDSSWIFLRLLSYRVSRNSREMNLFSERSQINKSDFF